MKIVITAGVNDLILPAVEAWFDFFFFIIIFFFSYLCKNLLTATGCS